MSETPAHSAYAHSMTRPLNLRQVMREPARGLAWIPWLDFCLLGVFFTLHGSPFLFAPGVNMELPEGQPLELQALPFNAVLTILPPQAETPAQGPSLALDYRQRTQALFDGKIFPLNQLDTYLQAWLADRRHPQPTLLIKADRQVTLELLLGVFATAEAAGFHSVQLAARETSQPTEFTD